MSPSKLVPGSRIGQFPYQIVNAIGEEGNMSDVYLASAGAVSGGPDASLVVMKIARTDEEHNEFYRQTMDNEVERLRRLKHPGIVRIYPIQPEGNIRNLPYTAEATALPGRPWFLMLEYLPGGSLADYIAAGPMEIGLALEIARSLASTLDYLHSRKQVHLDLKPDNILFRTPPQSGQLVEPVLIDFGIARDFGQGGLEARTLQYASPERVQDPKQPQVPPNLVRPHPAMDVYALGVILYEMLTARLPFNGRSRSSMTSEILKSAPPPPSQFRQEVNPELDNFVLSLLAKDQQKRPTALDAAVLFGEIAIKGGYQPRYPSRSGSGRVAIVRPRPRSSGSIITWLLTLFVVLQLVFILGTVRYWRSDLPLQPSSLNQLGSNLQLLVQDDLLPLFDPLGDWFNEMRSRYLPPVGVRAGAESKIGLMANRPPTSTLALTRQPQRGLEH